MNVTELEIKNFKTLKEFSGEFTKGVYLITGENEVGKTTLLKAITILLTGDRSDNLLSKDEKKGHIKGVICKEGQEFKVELRFTEKNPRGTLLIEAANGMRDDKRSTLQRIFNYKDIDVSEFVGWSDSAEGRRKQIDLIKGLMSPGDIEKLNFMDDSIHDLKESRKGKAKNLDVQQTILESIILPKEEKEGEKEIKPLNFLQKQLEESIKFNEKRKGVEERRLNRQEEIAVHDQKIKVDLNADEAIIKQKEYELEKLKNEYKAKKIELADKQLVRGGDQKAANTWLLANPQIKTEEKSEEIEAARKSNEDIIKRKDFWEKSEGVKKLIAEKDQINSKIEILEKSKRKVIKESSIPVDGLEFNEDGITLNGIPFASGEISTSQEIEVVSKLIIASNPTTKIFKVTRGESIGESKLKSLIEFANKEGYQGFIEEVKRGQFEMSVDKYTADEE